MPEHFDVLIIGAGLSGIGAGYHLQKECPKKTYAILEAREAIGKRVSNGSKNHSHRCVISGWKRGTTKVKSVP